MTPMAQPLTVDAAGSEPEAPNREVHLLSRRRWKVAVGLTSVMLVVYFAFVLGIAFNKAALGSLVAPGLSLGMALGVAVIFTAFGLTALYARWANRTYDPALEAALHSERGRA
jgi:uncharacterized membrane protein (DUF485 family)